MKIPSTIYAIRPLYLDRQIDRLLRAPLITGQLKVVVWEVKKIISRGSQMKTSYMYMYINIYIYMYMNIYMYMYMLMYMYKLAESTAKTFGMTGNDGRSNIQSYNNTVYFQLSGLQVHLQTDYTIPGSQCYIIPGAQHCPAKLNLNLATTVT